MVRSDSDLGRLYLTADLQPRDGWASQAMAKAACGSFEKLQRFPPIEDVVAALDNVASRTIAA